ncbi:hypothetical protein Tco_1183346 [Tanacetum coccineum]
MIPLYGNGDWTTMKFIRAFVECSPSLSDTINDICPNGQDCVKTFFLDGFSGEKVLILYVLAWRRRLDSRRAEFLLASVSFIVSFLRRSNGSTRLGAFPDELFRPSEVRVDYSA